MFWRSKYVEIFNLKSYGSDMNIITLRVITTPSKWTTPKQILEW